MTVKELIDKLNTVEDKSLVVTIVVKSSYGDSEYVELLDINNSNEELLLSGQRSEIEWWYLIMKARNN